MFRDDDARSRWQMDVAVPMDPPGSIDDMVALVDETEAEYGAISAKLVTPLSGLAAAYLEKNRTKEAIATLRRGIHVSRMEDGLHTPHQIGLVQQLIATHLKRGEFIDADAQQRYLYRLKTRGQDPRGDEFRAATLHYGNWVRSVYLADYEKERFPRLVEMQDIYADTLERIEELEGEDSPELLPYLRGLADVSYLLTVYPGERRQADRMTTANDSFWRFQRMNDETINFAFRQGLKSLKRQEEILRRSNASAIEVANARLAIADWYQWNERYADALPVYKEVWEFMSTEDQGEDWQATSLLHPLELPKETVFNLGPVPIDHMNTGEVSLRFDVSRHGKARNIEVLTPRSRETVGLVSQAYQRLKNVRFRPRVLNGEVVATENIERTYTIRY